MIKIFGIKQCSTMQKAFTWMEEHALPYEFHDYKKLGADVSLLQAWSDECGWEKLINRKGSTWRNLSEEDRTDMDCEKAIRLMHKNPSLIKRPILSFTSGLLIGFDEASFSQALRTSL